MTNKIQKYKDALERIPDTENHCSIQYFDTSDGRKVSFSSEINEFSTEVHYRKDLQTIVEQEETIERLKYYISAIKHKSQFQIGDYEGLQDVLRRIEWLTEEAINEGLNND